MAESYRGLTIRIGGDTTKLTQALKAANGAATQTQAELRKVGQALKLDPGNMTAYNMQLQQLSNQAQNTAMRLAQLKSSSAQLAGKQIKMGPDPDDVTSLKELSDATENASLRLSQARVNVSQLSHELGSMHNKVSELAKEASEVEKAKLAEAFNLAAGVKSVDEIRESFAKMPDGTERTKEQIDAIINSVEDLAKRLSGAVSVDTGEIDVDNLREAIDYFNKLSNGASISREAVKDLVKGLKEIGEIDEADFEVANDVEELKRKRDEAAKAEEANQESLRQKIRSTYDEAKSQVDALAAKNEEENERIAQSEEELASRLRSIDRDESDNRYDEQVEALSKVETAADRAKDALRQLHEGERELSTDDPLGVADNDYVNGIKQQYEDARKTEQAFFDESTEMSKKSHEAFKAGLEANKAGNKELYEQMSAESEKYFSRERELWASYQEAGRESHRLLGQEAVASYQVILDKATQVREAMVKVWAGSDRSYRDEATDNNAEGAIESEISAARNLLDSYRNYYKDVLRGLRRDLNQAQKDGENDLAARLKSEIEGYGQVRDTIVGMLKSHISKLTTELEGISDVRDVYLKEDADYSGRSTVQLYEDINSKIKDTQSLRDSELQKIAATRAEMEAAGKSQEEIASATADSVAEVERLDAKIKEMKADLATVAGGRGQYLKDAMGEALSERATEIADRERVTGEVAQKYEDQRAQAQREHDAERESAQKRIEANEREIASITSKAEEEMSTMASEMVESMDRAKQSADDLTSRIEQSEGVETFADKVRDAFAGLGDSLGDVVAEKFNFDMGNVDVDNLKKTLESITPDIGLDPSKIAAFVQEAERLKTAFAEADDEVKRAKLVAEFQDLLIEIEKGESSLTNFSRVLSDMKTPSDLVRGLYEINGSLSAMDEAYRGLMQMGSSLESAFKADPSNTEALTLAMQAYSAAQQVAIQNASTLDEKMSKFDTSRIAAGTDSTKSADQQLLDAAKAAEEAERSYDELKGKIADTEATIARLENTAVQTAADITGENEKAASTDRANNKELEHQYELRMGYNALLDDAAKKKSDTSEALQIAKERKELEEATAQAVQYADAIRKSTEAWAEASKQEAVLNVVGDTSNIDDLGKQLEAAASRAKVLQEAVKLDPKNVELLAAKEQAVADVSALVKRRTDEINQALAEVPTSKVESLRNTYGTISNAVKATTDATKAYGMQLNTARDKLNSLVKDAKFDAIRDDVLDVGKELDESLIQKLGDSAEEVIALRNAIAVLGPAFRDAAADMDLAAVISKNEDLLRQYADTTKLGDLTGKTGDQAAFMQAVQQIGQYAERAGRAVVESSNAIDAAYRDMRKTVQGTEGEFRTLREEAIKFSQTNITSAEEILEMEALGGQLGIATEALQNFGETASHLNIATDLDAEEIALKLGQMTNVMSDLDESTFDNFADALVRLGNNTATTESSIMNVAQRMSSVANVTSMTTPQLLAWSAAIASTGQRSESAATAISNTIEGIGNAVSEGGDTLEQFAAIAGMSAEEFEKAWRNSSSDALEAFVKGLGSLTEDSTAAIAALDKVGISSVRQETALLGLSQTIENLDSAMEMSNNAFHGISDEYGQAGDAAIEAQRKSEGFSGALGILQNSLTNLKASIGDGLVEPMRVIATVLNLLTDALNAIPGPIKSIIVTFGGLAAVIGTVYPALNTFTKGWKELADNKNVSESLTLAKTAIKALEDALGLTAAKAEFAKEALGGTAGAAGAATTTLNGTTVAANATGVGMTAAAAGTKLLSAALECIPGVLVITAITAAISAMTSMISEAYDRTMKLNEAATTAQSATKAMGEAYSSAMAQANEVDATKPLKQMKEETDKLIQGFIDFGNQVNNTFTEAGTQSALVSTYAEKINELGNQGSITEENLAKLKTVVAEYNSMTGESISIVNEHTGALSVNEEQLNKITEAYKEQAKAQAYAQAYKDELQHQIETEQELTEAQKELDEMTQKYGITLGEGYTLMLWNVDEARELETRINALNGELSRSDDRLTEYESGLGLAGDSVMSFSDAMASAGLTAEQYGDMTDEQKQKLAEIETALMKAGDSLSNYKDLNASQLAQIVSAWNGSVPDIVKAIKQIQNAQETSSKLESLANTAKQSITGATKEAVAAQKEADTEAYNQEKKRLDKEYKAQQKAYDAAYKARQKELDKEYKAAQKASQKYLKLLKEQQSEEVESFKETTDAKLKELEREYDAKKELLELEYKGYDTDLDERIQAIKDEQEAEDEAVKQQERREKLKELADAVATAKTKKKKEEAEKALSDYKAQLAREDTKAQRDAQIQQLQDQKAALKEQLSDRQDELKSSYDTAVESYKKAREDELKILQKQHEAIYESESELQSARLEMIKEAHSAELESMKETQQAELEMMKEANDAALENMKKSQAEYIKAMEDGTAEAMSNINNALEEAAAEIPYVGDLIKAGLVNISEDGVVSFTEKFKQMPGVTSEVMQLIVQQIADAIPGVKISAEGIASAVTDTSKQMHATLSHMPSLMGEAVEGGMRTMNSVIRNFTGPLGESTSAMLNVMTDPLKTLPAIDEMYARAGAQGIANGFADESAVAAVQYAAEQMVKAGTEPTKVMALLNEQFGANSAWALANGYSNQQANEAVSRVAESIVDANGDVLKVMSILNDEYGQSAVISLANSISKASDKPINVFTSMLNAVQQTMSGMDKGMDTSGWNSIINFVNGMNRAQREAVNAAMNIAQSIFSILHHSTPDRGPLKDDDKWGGDFVQNFIDSMMARAPELERMTSRIAGSVERGFVPDVGSTDLIGNLIDNMRAQESRLLEQSRRMADIVERGFDPRLTVAAAYEAIDQIDAGELRRQQMVASAQNVDNSTYAPVINISIPEVVIREEADIDRLSQQIAIRVQRSINARIG